MSDIDSDDEEEEEKEESKPISPDITDAADDVDIKEEKDDPVTDKIPEEEDKVAEGEAEDGAKETEKKDPDSEIGAAVETVEAAAETDPGEEKKTEALSDLSLSDDEFGADISGWLVLDEAGADEKVEEASEECRKCDVAHRPGQRCTFLLQSTITTTTSTRGRGRGRARGGERERDERRSRVRTLPPELYQNPQDRERRSYRSRSPQAQPRPRRVAPPPPSPPPTTHYEERSCQGSWDQHQPAMMDFQNYQHQHHHLSQSQPPQPPQPPQPQYSHNYSECLQSLQPLQGYMSAKMVSMPGQPFPPSYVELLVSNVGKMLAQASLGLRELSAAFRLNGDEFVRGLLSRELHVYAQRFPGGVNLPLIIQTTIEYLQSCQFHYA